MGHASSYVNPLTTEAKVPYEAGPFHIFTHYFPFTLPFVITVKKFTNSIQHAFLLSQYGTRTVRHTFQVTPDSGWEQTKNERH